ncbi:hypothetical protein [Liberibacter crescens]|uniref:hypothetical protein n=1 Tax=Liberibacter crescens TaxID=1273132 RepID=UPI001181B6A5|nr:hypothetical protein [Liberibacter crescens]
MPPAIIVVHTKAHGGRYNDHKRRCILMDNCSINSSVNVNNDMEVDPLYCSIRAYEEACDFLNYTDIETDNSEFFSNNVISQQISVLESWTFAVKTAQSALDALRLAIKEMEYVDVDPLIASMIRAAFGYFSMHIQ